MVGLIYNAKILHRALDDFFEVRARRINSLREYSARLTVFVYVMLSFVQAAFVLIGVISMIIPPANHSTPVSALQIVLTSIFIFVSFVLAAGAYINERGRRQLVAKIAELEKF